MEYIPIVPSSLIDLNRSDSSTDAFSNLFNDFTLKSGVVVSAYPADDKKNISKATTEYDVLTMVQDKDLGTSAVLYKNCIVSDMFGGMGDFFEYTYRASTEDALKSKDPQLKDGAIVLLLCMNGNSEKAVIVGSLKHPKRKFVMKKEQGHHLEGEFNGVNIQINKDGEFVLTFKSKTDNKGTPQDEEAGGSFLKIDKTGSIEISDGNKEFIKIDKKEKQILLEAEKKLISKTKDNTEISAEKEISLKSKKDMILESQGAVKASSKKAFEITADGKLKAKGASVTLEADGKVDIKGQAINIAGTQVQVGGAGGSPAPTAQLQMIGTGNNGAPVISSVMSGLSTTVFIK